MSHDGNTNGLRTLVLGLLVFAIGGSVLAFGSVELWAREALRFVAILTLAVVLWSRPLGEVLGGRAGRVALPVVLLVAWGLFQSVPLPSGVVSLVSPSSAEIQERTTPPGGDAPLGPWLAAQAAEDPEFTVEPYPADPAEAGGGRTLSLHAPSTRRACLAWITGLLFFFAGAWMARSKVARYRLLWWIVAFTGGLGVLAIAQKISWNQKILWFRKFITDADPLGPFVSATNFAGWAEMGILVGLGLGLALLSHPNGRLDMAGIRAAVVDHDFCLPRLVAVGGLLAPAIVGMVLARSPGGWTSLAVGVVFLLVARRFRRVPPLLLVAVVVVGVGVGFAALAIPGLGDLQTSLLADSDLTPSFLLRVDAWDDTARIFLDFPVAGTGVGTFHWIYPRYQRVGEWMTWEETHNDYLQLASETGLVGVALLAWAVFALIRRVFRPMSSGLPSSPPRWTTLGAAAAVFAMATHSIVDFNLQIPSHAVLFAVLMGVVTAAVGDEGERRPES